MLYLSKTFFPFSKLYDKLYFMDKKPVTFRIDPHIIKQLKYLALDNDRTLTDLFLEAIQDLLEKYERNPEK
jgi:hypothetical protein